MGRLLCWLGLHKWAYVGSSEFLDRAGWVRWRDEYHVCERCRRERVRQS